MRTGRALLPRSGIVRPNPTCEADPLVRAIERLWQEQRSLLPRWTALRRLGQRTPYEEGELRVIEARVFAMRALSRRFCTILRDEAWARYESKQAASAPSKRALPVSIPTTNPIVTDSERP